MCQEDPHIHSRPLTCGLQVRGGESHYANMCVCGWNVTTKLRSHLTLPPPPATPKEGWAWTRRNIQVVRDLVGWQLSHDWRKHITWDEMGGIELIWRETLPTPPHTLHVYMCFYEREKEEGGREVLTRAISIFVHKIC